MDGHFIQTGDYPDPNFVSLSSNIARHLICTREATPTRVNGVCVCSSAFRDFQARPIHLHSPSDGLLETLLHDWDRNCSATPDLNRPFVEMRAYTDEHAETRYDRERWLAQYERYTNSKRALCSDPMPRGALSVLLVLMWLTGRTQRGRILAKGRLAVTTTHDTLI